MFVQVIEGRVRDAEALARQWQRWMQELSPEAVGWLGSTAGITPEGQLVAAVRFESAAAAEENSGRPAQSRWWAETEEALADVAFHESSDCTSTGRPSDEAGFVQLLHARAADRARLEELDAVLTEGMQEHRPDLLGGYQIWLDGDALFAVNYFTSEDDARAGEARQPPPEIAERVEEMMSLLRDVRWFDLPDPWLHSPG